LNRALGGRIRIQLVRIMAIEKNGRVENADLRYGEILAALIDKNVFAALRWRKTRPGESRICSWKRNESAVLPLMARSVKGETAIYC